MFITKNTKRILAVALALSLNACATIVSDTKYPLSITSNPPQAFVEVTDDSGMKVFQGETPAVVSLESGDGFFSKAHYNIKISKPGYQDYSWSINPELDPWYFGNILFGGIVGALVVDPISGAMYEIDEKVINANLSSGSSFSDSPSARSTWVAPRSSVSTSRGGDDAAISRLAKLKSLRADGILTEGEYQQKRREILSSF